MLFDKSLSRYYLNDLGANGIATGKHFYCNASSRKYVTVCVKASQCGYVVSTLASRQGDPGSNPIAARKSCEVYPGWGILQPQWNPYPTLTPPSC